MPNIPTSEARTVCVSSARTGLCGGQRVTAVPTATSLVRRVTPWSPLRQAVQGANACPQCRPTAQATVRTVFSTLYPNLPRQQRPPVGRNFLPFPRRSACSYCRKLSESPRQPRNCNGVRVSLSSMAGGLLLVAFALYVIVIAWRWAVRKRRAFAPLTWPLADVRIERSYIERHEHPDGGVSWALKFDFSYQAPPESHWFKCVYTQELGFEGDAETQLLSLRERHLHARYNPSEPSEYFIDPYRDIFKDEQGSLQKILKH